MISPMAETRTVPACVAKSNTEVRWKNTVDARRGGRAAGRSGGESRWPPGRGCRRESLDLARFERADMQSRDTLAPALNQREIRSRQHCRRNPAELANALAGIAMLAITIVIKSEAKRRKRPVRQSVGGQIGCRGMWKRGRSGQYRLMSQNGKRQRQGA
jgi:hypothetical protein